MRPIMRSLFESFGWNHFRAVLHMNLRNAKFAWIFNEDSSYGSSYEFHMNHLVRWKHRVFILLAVWRSPNRKFLSELLALGESFMRLERKPFRRFLSGLYARLASSRSTFLKKFETSFMCTAFMRAAFCSKHRPFSFTLRSGVAAIGRCSIGERFRQKGDEWHSPEYNFPVQPVEQHKELKPIRWMPLLPCLRSTTFGE